GRRGGEEPRPRADGGGLHGAGGVSRLHVLLAVPRPRGPEHLHLLARLRLNTDAFRLGGPERVLGKLALESGERGDGIGGAGERPADDEVVGTGRERRGG